MNLVWNCVPLFCNRYTYGKYDGTFYGDGTYVHCNIGPENIILFNRNDFQKAMLDKSDFGPGDGGAYITEEEAWLFVKDSCSSVGRHYKNAGRERFLKVGACTFGESEPSLNSDNTN